MPRSVPRGYLLIVVALLVAAPLLPAGHSRTDGIFAIEAEAVREEDRLMDALPVAHRTLGDRETPLHPGN